MIAKRQPLEVTEEVRKTKAIQEHAALTSRRCCKTLVNFDTSFAIANDEICAHLAMDSNSASDAGMAEDAEIAA